MALTAIAFPESALAAAAQLRDSDPTAFKAALLTFALTKIPAGTLAAYRTAFQSGRIAAVRHTNGYISIAGSLSAATSMAAAGQTVP